MLPERVLRVADTWWARDFGVGPGELRPSATHVQAHAGELRGDTGIWILVVGEHPMISLPPALLPALGARAKQWTRAYVADPVRLVSQLEPGSFTKIVGPASINYATVESLTRLDPELAAVKARQLVADAADEDAVARLRASCVGEEWEHGGSELGNVPCFGAYDATGELAALAGYEVWQENIAHISIVSATRHRGRGFGTAAVALAARHALDAGLLPQYRTLVSNTAALQVARKLGFVEYGFSLYVRIADE